ncbi:phosphoribosylaminoimidazole carboxylase [Aureococcus anophagefferens]|nr:phosphoribosylaminoimidazole carboxylase [Aureococcus anophagefferens]
MSTPPLVGVIMGSDSDLPVMKACCEMLDKFGVPYECTIVSAHRTPQRLCEYASGAKARGLRVVVAGAGGAAHLPGMVAAMTTLPVVGVPVKTSALSGAYADAQRDEVLAKAATLEGAGHAAYLAADGAPKSSTVM